MESAEVITGMRASAFPSTELGGRCLVVLVLLCAVLVSGCGEAAPPSRTSLPPATSSVAPTAVPTPTGHPVATPTLVPTPASRGAAQGLTAPDFEFILFQGADELGGDQLRLSDLGGRPIVLNFWARFCGPCWKEMPELQHFYEESGKDVLLLGIDVGQFTGLGLPKDAGKLLDSLGVTYPAGFTDDGRVVAMYGIRAMPTTIFIDSDRRVFRSWSGSINRQQLDSIVSDLLEKE